MHAPRWSIELACADDIPRVAALANHAAEVSTANFATTPEPVADWMAQWAAQGQQYPWLVAHAGGRVVGFAKAGPHKTRGAYRWTAEMSIYLDPDWQGRGLGKALYGKLIPMLREQGYVTLLAGITTGLLPSEKLHERFGFVRCATFHRSGWKHDAWHDVSYWELQLTSGDTPPATIRPVTQIWHTLSA